MLLTIFVYSRGFLLAYHEVRNSTYLGKRIGSAVPIEGLVSIRRHADYVFLPKSEAITNRCVSDFGLELAVINSQHPP